MISRYKYDKIARIWEDQNRFKIWLDIEKKYLEVLEDLGEISGISKLLDSVEINTHRIREIEKTTRHETVAFIDSILEQNEDLELYFHKGITSSDIIDTSFSIQLRDSGKIILQEIQRLLLVVKDKAIEFKDLVSVARTHGIHAEPSIFGLKFLSFYEELKRAHNDFFKQIDAVSICMLSGAVGTYSLIKPEYENLLAERLGLKTLNITTQIVPRDIYARYFNSLAVLAGVIERMAIELRHLQQTELAEVTESFNLGQTGSSVMPHKKNPISLENITGLSRLIRGYASTCMENIVVWGERDISHSSVERIIAPDATNLSAYILSRMYDIIAKLSVNKEVIKDNLEKTRGTVMSSLALKILVDSGVKRKRAYKIIQDVSFALLQDRSLTFDEVFVKKLEKEKINIDLTLLKYESFVKHVSNIYKKVLS